MEEKPVAFTVPPLPYPFDALEPYIDAKTMEIHHDKHHGAYVANLNKALEGHPDLQSKSIDDLMKNLDAIPENIRTAVRNNGGGHWNHSFFWRIIGALLVPLRPCQSSSLVSAFWNSFSHWPLK